MNSSYEVQQFVLSKNISHARTDKSQFEGLFRKRKISDREKAEFFTQLAVMLQSRVSLHRALEVLKLQAKSVQMIELVTSLLKDVQKGFSFSKALAHHPEMFDELAVATVEVGQETGNLGEVLSGLSHHLEKMNGLRRKVLQALTYPILVISVASVVVGFLLLFIVPTFAEMFRNFQLELPWSTKAILQISESVSTYGLYSVVFVIVMILVLKGYFSSDAAKERLESLIIRLPFVGTILVKNYVARFCRTLGTMLQAQVSLIEALNTASRIISNSELRVEINGIAKHVRQGKALAEPIVSSKFFPPMVAQMITVGEETSELDKMLLKVAEYYEKEIDGTVETLSNLIEPVIVLFLGLVVAAILISMYLPMFDVVNVVGGP